MAAVLVAAAACAASPRLGPWRSAPHHPAAPVSARSRVLAQALPAGQPTLSDWLARQEGKPGYDPDIADVIHSVFAATALVAGKIRTASCDSQCCFNQLGSDDQLAIDLLANEVMVEGLQRSGKIASVSARNEPYVVPLGGSHFSVAFDALDSSSSVDVNFAVGASWSVYRGTNLTGVTGREMLAAGLATYGPRTSVLMAAAFLDGAHEFVLYNEGEGGAGAGPGPEGAGAGAGAVWLQSNTFDAMLDDSPARRAIFAPGNLRATKDNPGYRKLVDSYISRQLPLRYSGGMVPDVSQLIIRGCGIFTNPGGKGPTAARISLLYEAAPAAFVMEKAGGASSDGARSILDVPIEDTDQRTAVALGSKGEVRAYEEVVGPDLHPRPRLGGDGLLDDDVAWETVEPA